MSWSYLFFSFDGRIGRKQYWIGSCVLIAAAIVIAILEYRTDDHRWGGIAELALLYPDIAIIIKRAHDREMKLWIPVLYVVLSVLLNAIVILGLDGPLDDPSALYLAVTVPNIVVALYLIVDLGFRRGVSGPNRFGPDPLAVPH